VCSYSKHSQTCSIFIYAPRVCPSVRSVALISAGNEGENARRSGGSLFLSAKERFPDCEMRVRVRYWDRPLLRGSKYITLWKYAGEFESIRYWEVSAIRRCPLAEVSLYCVPSYLVFLWVDRGEYLGLVRKINENFEV